VVGRQEKGGREQAGAGGVKVVRYPNPKGVIFSPPVIAYLCLLVVLKIKVVPSS
jgi:hypothetical protein